MEIPKQKVVELLKKEGKSEQAQKVDHELHTDLLEKHGVNVQELVSKL